MVVLRVGRRTSYDQQLKIEKKRNRNEINIVKINKKWLIIYERFIVPWIGWRSQEINEMKYRSMTMDDDDQTPRAYSSFFSTLLIFRSFLG